MIGVRGNCFCVRCDDCKVRKVFNIGLESFQATGVPFPIEGDERDGFFVVTDVRIPPEAYRSEGCFCMGGQAKWEAIMKTPPEAIMKTPPTEKAFMTLGDFVDNIDGDEAMLVFAADNLDRDENEVVEIAVTGNRVTFRIIGMVSDDAS